MDTRVGVCHISKDGLFNNLDQNSRQKIVKESLVHELGQKGQLSNEILIKDKVYLLRDGCALLSSIDENGKKMILDILTQDSVFGNLDFTGPSLKDSNLFIEPFPQASICEMSKDKFAEIIRDNPEFAVLLLSTVASRLAALEQKVGKLVFSDVEARLLSQLLDLSRRHGKENARSVHLEMRLTHEQLAGMIGAARETVSGAMAELRKKGILSQDKHRHFRVNKDQLKSLF